MQVILNLVSSISRGSCIAPLYQYQNFISRETITVCRHLNSSSPWIFVVSSCLFFTCTQVWKLASKIGNRISNSQFVGWQAARQCKMGQQRFGCGYSSKCRLWSHINARICKQRCSSYNHFLSKGDILQSFKVNIVDKGRDFPEFHQCSGHLSWLWSWLCKIFKCSWNLKLLVCSQWISPNYELEFHLIMNSSSDYIPRKARWAYLPHRVRNLLLHIRPWCPERSAGL